MSSASALQTVVSGIPLHHRATDQRVGTCREPHCAPNQRMKNLASCLIRNNSRHDNTVNSSIWPAARLANCCSVQYEHVPPMTANVGLTRTPQEWSFQQKRKFRQMIITRALRLCTIMKNVKRERYGVHLVGERRPRKNCESHTDASMRPIHGNL